MVVAAAKSTAPPLRTWGPNMRTSDQLRREALQIWHAGVAAVAGDRLVREHVLIQDDRLRVGQASFDLKDIDRIAVVGGGKAGAAMAVGLEQSLGESLLAEKRVCGWVNVPEGSARSTSHIHLHPARPPSVNEPTESGVLGARRILELVGSLGKRDLCIVLLSGGGSALLPAPAEGVSLADKVAVTRLLSASGATIEELNTVRRSLSSIKGGGLARACRAGTLVALIISDVMGDALPSIASGPTVLEPTTAADARAVLDRYIDRDEDFAGRLYSFLENRPAEMCAQISTRVHNFVIGNNARAVQAAGAEARRLGYTPEMRSAQGPEGLAEDIGCQLAALASAMRDGRGPDCLISGGEPVVQLVESGRRGKGGRNQQLALAAAQALWDDGAERITLLSGGTDGEDGPTDAAGAMVAASVIRRAKELGQTPERYLESNDAYRFFAPLDALLITGATGTNVCDVRVVVVDRSVGI